MNPFLRPDYTWERHDSCFMEGQTEAQHQSYQLGRGTTSLISPGFSNCSQTGVHLSASEHLASLGRNRKTPVCSWSTTRLPNIVPPSYLLRPELDTGVMTAHTPNPIFECPSLFVSHLIVQPETKNKKHLFRGSLIRVPTPWPRETLNLVCFSQCLAFWVS